LSKSSLPSILVERDTDTSPRPNLEKTMIRSKPASILFIVLAALLTVSLTSCGRSQEEQPSPAPPAAPAADEANDAEERARQEAAEAETAARERAEAAITAAVGALGEARDALDAAQGVRGIQLDVATAGGDLASAAEMIESARGSLRSQQFAEAEMQAENARGVISDVVRRISTAVRAASRK
jgi:hypothetical protein